MQSLGLILLLVPLLVSRGGQHESRPQPPARLPNQLDEPSPLTTRLGFIDLQAGSRGAPQRVIFSVPPQQGVQRPLFDLLLGRALLGVCVDRTRLTRPGLATRPLRRNATVSLPTQQPLPEVWDLFRKLAIEHEKSISGSPALALLLQLRGRNLSGVSFAHMDSLPEIEVPFIGAAAVIEGHRAISDMHEVAQKRRANGKQCTVSESSLRGEKLCGGAAVGRGGVVALEALSSPSTHFPHYQFPLYAPPPLAGAARVQRPYRPSAGTHR